MLVDHIISVLETIFFGKGFSGHPLIAYFCISLTFRDIFIENQVTLFWSSCFVESLSSKLSAKVKSENFVPDTPEPRISPKKSPAKVPFKTKAKVMRVVAKIVVPYMYICLEIS